MMVVAALIVPLPASVKLPPLWMSIVQPLQLRVSPLIGFGIALLTIKTVGVPLVSAAESPVAHPGKPPAGLQTAPDVSVQLPNGGGALDVTL
jgi:hypothetical protein